jgi:hypothetical protein
MRQRYGDHVCVLGWIGAAGDQCPAQHPHLMYYQNAEERMRILRKETHLDEIAKRIVHAVEDVYDAVKSDRHANVELIHRVESLRLPMRVVTEAEYLVAQSACQEIADKISHSPKAADLYAMMKWREAVVRRFERQRNDPTPQYEVELHVLRIGDIVICTNPFELFTDYGIQLKARSPALQTFAIQLTGDYGGYVPTETAIRGGSYSALVESNRVGPEGGQILVDRTIDAIDHLWKVPLRQ